MQSNLLERIPRVAFDESGNTGANLLDLGQPVFVLASVLEQSEAATLIPENGELRFKKLIKSADGRSRIVRILNDPILAPDRAFVTAFHKRYMVVTKIVDLLIETFAHEIGHDLYAQGGNIALTNLLYFTGPTFIGRTRFDKLLASFVEMLRRPSSAATDRFYGIVESAFAASTEDGLRPQLGILRATRHIAEDLTAAKDDSALDPAIPAFFLLAAEWTKRLASPFTVLHDESKPLKNEQIILEAMMSTSEPPQTIGYDRRTHPFPLAATGIVFGSSKVEPMLQVADILAGSVALVLRCRAQGRSERFAEEIMKTDALSGTYAPVWPHLAIDPDEMGTNAPAPRADPHQLVGDYIANRLGGIPPVSQRRKL